MDVQEMKKENLSLPLVLGVIDVGDGMVEW